MSPSASSAGEDENGRGLGAVTELRDRLRRAIVTGEIPASAARTQAELAASLGVSRTPLREALRMLEFEHLIIRESNGRFRAADLRPDEIEELGVIRITLEAAAVRVTTPDLSIADHAALEGLLAESRRLAQFGEWTEFERAHRRFHATLTQGAGPMHTQQLDRLWEQEARYRRAFEAVAEADGRDRVSQDEHRAILDAVEAGDGERAGELVAEHHARAVREIGAHLAAGHALTRVSIALELEQSRTS